MKNILITFFITAALGPFAQAGSISFDSRADFEANQYNDEAESSTSSPRDNHRFAFHTLRLDAKGNMNSEIAYRLRFRFNNAALATKNNRDNLNSAIDFSYIQHTLTEVFALQMGKFGTDIGGIEGMTSGPDLYMTSKSYSEQSASRYSTGLKGIYTFAGQEFNLTIANQQTDADANGSVAAGGFNQNRETIGFVYKGNFLDKALMPVLSYHEDNVQPTGTTGTSALKKKYAYLSAGLKYDFTSFFIEADYISNTLRSRSIDEQADKINSLVGTIGFRFTDKIVAKAKFESSDEETFSSATSSSKDQTSGYQLALEYLPSGDKNFRYHVAYFQKGLKPEVGETENTEQMVAGVRLYHDFMK